MVVNKLTANKRGQVIVEYLLIMVIVVASAAFLTKALVGRSDSGSGQGLVIKSWNRIITGIGNDLADCPKQTDMGSPNCP